MKMQRTFQFHGDSVLEHSIVGAAIGSDGPIGIGVQHGWRTVGEPMVVTASSANRVLTLDDQPAVAAYLQRLNAPPEVQTDPEAFTRFAMTHPLGLSRRSVEEVRFRRWRRPRRGFADLHRRPAPGKPGLDHGGRPRLGARGD
jgi:hypothetical protein